MGNLEVALHKVATITMGTSPKGTTYNHEGIGLPLLNGPTEFGETRPHCTLYTTDSKKECKAGDLIFCVRGSTTGRMNWSDRLYSLGRGLCSIRGETSLDTKFIRYCIEWKLDELLNLAGGSTFPNLTKDTIRNFPIPYPESRHKIAAVLSAYDNLIENNIRRIKILEEMAGAIYREWFIEFRFPGHEKLPMVESELGLIPQGWEAKFSDYVDFKEGPGLRRWQYRDNGIPFLNIRTLGDSDIDLSKVQYLDQDEVERKYSHFLLQPDDHVVSSSGTIGRIVTIQQHHLPLMLNTSIIRMRAKTENVGLWQLKHFLKSNYFQNQIHTLATGTAQKNYGPSHLKRMNIIAPDVEIGRSYETIVKPMEESIGRLVMKNANLRQTRDLLLPKLISGELDVSDLEIDTG